MKLHRPAKAIAAHTDVRNELSSVRIAEIHSSTETDVPCTRLVVAAGAWSPAAFAALFPHSPLRLPVSRLAGHSLVLRSPRWTSELAGRVGCHAVYTTSPAGFSPEVYARAGGQLYLAGLNSAAIPLPERASDAKVDPRAIEALRETARELLGPSAGEEGPEDGDDDDLEVVREGLCFRPVTSSGVPLLGRISDEDLGVGVATRPGADGGVFVSAGHGPWGISLGLGSGKVLAEMMQGRRLSADVRALELR